MLLTRSPLVYPRRGLTVRLACVKHAASVRPEPGSNSPLKNFSKPDTPKSTRPNSCHKQRVQPLTEPKTGSINNHHSKKPHPADKHPPPTNSDRHPPTRHEALNKPITALTFSTLLSSQNSDTHQPETQHPGLGQLAKHYLIPVPESNSAPETSQATPNRPRVSVLRRDAPGPDCCDLCLGPPGRPPDLIDLGVLHPVKAWTTLRRRDTRVKPVRHRTRLPGRPPRQLPRVTLTAATVRLPRRAMTKPPGSRSCSVRTASASVTFVLFR